jgi:RHS repeat-associated protein
MEQPAPPPPYTNDLGGPATGTESAPSAAIPASPKAVLAVPARSAAYVFGPGGERQSQTVDGVETSYAYNSAHQLVSETAPGRSVDHAYDELGNEITRATTAVTQTPQGPVSETTTETYGYNHLNLLSTYSNSKTGALWQYDYYPTGERYGKTDLDANAGEVYVPRFGEVVAEYGRVGSASDVSIRPKNTFVGGLGLNSKNIRIGADGSRRHMIGDRVGTVGMTLDEGGAAVDTTVKDPWGVTLAGSTSEPYGGVAQSKLDPESGLTFMRHRMYDPALGRFTQTDPILGNRPGKHYAYASNNPVNLVDPLGLDDSPYSLKNWWEDIKGLVGLSSAGTWNGLAGTGGQRASASGKAGVLRPTMHAAEIGAGGIIGEGLAATSIVTRSVVQGGFLALEETAYRGVTEGEVPTAKGFAAEAATYSAAGILIEGTFALGSKAWSGLSQKGASKLDQLIEKFRNPFAAEGSEQFSIGPGAASEFDPATLGEGAEAGAVRVRGNLGKEQGREFRTDQLSTYEFDPNQPSHIRGWLKQERRLVEQGRLDAPRTPPGFVQAHGRQTPAQEGFDYSNSRMQTEELNKLEEAMRRRYEAANQR